MAKDGMLKKKKGQLKNILFKLGFSRGQVSCPRV